MLRASTTSRRVIMGSLLVSCEGHVGGATSAQVPNKAARGLQGFFALNLALVGTTVQRQARFWWPFTVSGWWRTGRTARPALMLAHPAHFSGPVAFSRSAFMRRIISGCLAHSTLFFSGWP
jgi:hypothetical protein